MKTALKTAIEAAMYLRASNAWASHDKWTRDWWRAEVDLQHTQRGYWDWVFNNIEQDEDIKSKE